jgi:hypothetical protein
MKCAINEYLTIILQLKKSRTEGINIIERSKKVLQIEHYFFNHICNAKHQFRGLPWQPDTNISQNRRIISNLLVSFICIQFQIAGL